MSSKEASLPQSSPNTPGVGSSAKITTAHWFTSEIQQMMHGFGDCRRPLHESAVLVEEIVQQQMAALLYKASEIAQIRTGRLIGLEDFLFLLRKDKVKMRRLLKFLEVKDLRSVVKTMDDDDQTDAGEKIGAAPMKKRRRTCQEFLASIDQTGELMSLFDEDVDFVDEVKNERLLRADIRSRGMDTKQYFAFTEARQVNFGKKYKSQRFKDWLLSGLVLDIKPTIHAMEVISYMAYETIAQIVDLALIVKQDMRAQAGDPLTHHYPNVVHSLHSSSSSGSSTAASAAKTAAQVGITSPTATPPGTPTHTPGTSGTTSQPPTPGAGSSSSLAAKAKSKKKKKGGQATSMETSTSQAILPSDIREAMRRYSAYVGPFASEMKVNRLYSPKSRTLCV